MFLSNTNFENYIKWKRKRVSKMKDHILISNKSFTSSENPSHMVLCIKFQKKIPMNIYLSNYHRVRQQRVYGLSTRLPYRYLMDCTVSLHSIRWNAQQDSQWPLKWWKFSPIIWARIHCNWRISQLIFTPAIHKSVMPASWKQCAISHWQSHSHQTMTV